MTADGHEDGPDGPAGTVSTALDGVLAGLVGGLAPDDPKQVMAAIARTMAERIDAGAPGMTGVVGLLLQLVKDLGAEPGRPGDRFDAVLVTRHQRRLASAIAQAEAQARAAPANGEQ